MLSCAGDRFTQDLNKEKENLRHETENNEMATQLNEFVQELSRRADKQQRQRDVMINAQAQLLERTLFLNKDTMDCIMKL